MQFRVTFSEPVTGVAASDFQAITTGTATAGAIAVTGSGAVYTVTVSGLGGAGTVGLNLIDNDTITNVLSIPSEDHPLGGVGIGNGNFTGPTYTIDLVPPVVSSITTTAPTATTGSTVTFTVTFSEPVTGVAASDFALAVNGLTGAAITSVTGAGATYTVTANTGTGTGSLALELVDDDSIADIAGNPLGGAGPGNGNFTGQYYLVQAPSTSSVATVVLPAIDLNLLGLEVQTSEIIISVSANQGNGELLGNLLTTASDLINLQQAANALNQVLSTTVGLLNSSTLGLNLGGGLFATAPVATTNVLTLHVAPVNLNLLGALVNTNPIDVSITAHSGPGLVLGNIVTDLANLFNNLPGTTLNIDTINTALGNLLDEVNTVLGAIPSANVPTVQPNPGQVLSLTVPSLDLNLLGLQLNTTPITVNATANTGSGNLLGNVLTSLLNTFGATPDSVAQLNNTLNGILAKVVGALNTASLTIPSALVAALPPALQTLLNPTLVAPAGSSAQILDLVIASQNGTTPPVDVNLLGLNVTTSNIDATLSAVTGDGQILGNLLYNVANLANPGGSSGLLTLLNALGSGNLTSTAGSTGGSLSGTTSTPQQLLQLQLQPLDLNLLGLQVQTDPITVTLSAQGGDGELLGNLLGAAEHAGQLPGRRRGAEQRAGDDGQPGQLGQPESAGRRHRHRRLRHRHRLDHAGPRRVRGPGESQPARPGGHHQPNPRDDHGPVRTGSRARQRRHRPGPPVRQRAGHADGGRCQ